MAGWYSTVQAMSWRGRMVLAAAGAALVLVAVVPLALFAGLILMLAGHATVGLAVFGGSVLAAIAGVTIAAKAGVRHVRSLIRRAADTLNTGTLNADAGTEGTPTAGSRAKGPRVVRLSEGDYRIT